MVDNFLNIKLFANRKVYSNHSKVKHKLPLINDLSLLANNCFRYIALSTCNIKGRVEFKRELKINIANLSLKECDGIFSLNSRIDEWLSY